MKMESPLDVLSRAASIVQNKGNPKRLSDRSPGSEDSGFEEDLPNKTSQLSSPESTEISHGRRSPKRQHSVTEKTFKKLKLNDEEEDKHRISPKEYVFKSSVPTCTTQTMSQHPLKHGILQISQSNNSTKTDEGTPPPLIAINETRKLPDYDSLFPRPSVISTSPPSTYIDYYRGSRPCGCHEVTCTNTFSKYPIPSFKKSTMSTAISKDFQLPTVDDHFRKSLGDKYDISKHCQNLNERPSSVDEHFAKALGNKWYSLNYSRCASS